MISRQDYEAICESAKKATILEQQISLMHQEAQDPLLAEIAMDILQILRPEVSDRLLRLSRTLEHLVEQSPGV